MAEFRKTRFSFVRRLLASTGNRAAVELLCAMVAFNSPANVWAACSDLPSSIPLTAATISPGPNFIWSGYIARDDSGRNSFVNNLSDYTNVLQMTFRVPDLTWQHVPITPSHCQNLDLTKPFHSTSVWAGWGGAGSTTIAQAGVSLNFNCTQILGYQHIELIYKAFVQMDPLFGRQFQDEIKVSPGDNFTVSLSPVDHGVWFTFSSNGHELKSFILSNPSFPLDAAGSSAEWVVEHQPTTINGQQVPTFMSEYRNIFVFTASALNFTPASASHQDCFARLSIFPGEFDYEPPADCYNTSSYRMQRVPVTDEQARPLSSAMVVNDSNGCPNQLLFTYCGPQSGRRCN